MSGRSRLTIAIAAMGMLISAAAGAQEYPTKPITLIVPWPAGGSTDIAMRAIADSASKVLGQPIAIDNKAGGGGTVGPATMAAAAKPDGYTIAQIPITVFRAPFMSRTSFDPTRDLTYVIALTGYTFGVVVRDDAPWKTFGDLLADAKRNPGKINYGTPGAGTSLHITMEQIAKQQGIQWTHIPFKGSADTTNALLGGHIHAVADSTGWAPQVEAGKFRLLVTWGAGRTRNWPNVPTLHDIGIDMVSNSPFGIAGPKGIDPKIVQVLHDAFRKGLEDPAYVAAMVKFDQEPFYLGSEDYRAFALKQIAEQKQLIEELGLRPD